MKLAFTIVPAAVDRGSAGMAWPGLRRLSAPSVVDPYQVTCDLCTEVRSVEDYDAFCCSGFCYCGMPIWILYIISITYRQLPFFFPHHHGVFVDVHSSDVKEDKFKMECARQQHQRPALIARRRCSAKVCLIVAKVVVHLLMATRATRCDPHEGLGRS